MLRLGWSHILTLNVDDGIESSTSRYKQIVCNRRYNSEILDEKLLVKIHGDAFSEFSDPTGESKVIFSSSDYSKSIESNKDLMGVVRNLWEEANVFFIGCSLTKEEDLLYLLDSSQLTRNLGTSRIFFTPDAVSAERVQSLKYEFGVTHVIVFKHDSQVYEILMEMFPEPITEGGALLEAYLFSKVSRLEGSSLECTKHLIREKRFLEAHPDFDRLYPPYLARRDTFARILSSIDKNAFTMIEGRRFSGLTSALKTVMKYYESRDPYYFDSTSRITRGLVDKVIASKERLFVFDSRVLSAEHIHKLLHARHQIDRNATRILVACSPSENQISSPIFDAYPEESIYLTQELSNDEVGEINKTFDAIGISRWRQNSRLLENIYYSTKIYHQYESTVFPSDISLDTGMEALMLFLFVKESVLLQEARVLGYSRDDFSRMVSILSPVVELVDNDFQPVSTGKHKLVLGCKPWLPQYFTKRYPFEKADRFSELLLDLTRRIKGTSLETSLRFQFIRVDTLKAVLPESYHQVAQIIYPLLRDDFGHIPDFWLQWAKAKLYTAKTIPEMEESLQYVQKAEADGTRKTQKNAAFTKAIILGKMCKIESFQNVERCVEAVLQYDLTIRGRGDNSKYVMSLRDENNTSSATLLELVSHLRRTMPRELLRARNEFENVVNFIESRSK